MNRGCQGDAGTLAALGLGQDALRLLIQGIAGRPVARIEARLNQGAGGHRGYGRPKHSIVVQYEALGLIGETFIFMKSVDTANAEPQHYQYLHQHHAPVPTLYGRIDRPGVEVLLMLEHVRVIGERMPWPLFFADDQALTSALRAIARFNAIQPSAAYDSMLPRMDCARSLRKAAGTLDEVWARGLRGDLGEELGNLCTQGRTGLPRLQQHCYDLIPPIAAMETGLLHGDFYPDSVGWRHGSSEAVVFDLETVRIGPRFMDVADWLGAADGELPLGQPRHDLAQLYLDEYARHGGLPPSVDTQLSQARTLHLYRLLTMLWFVLGRAHDGEVDWTEDRAEGRRVYRGILGNQLRELLAECA